MQTPMLAGKFLVGILTKVGATLVSTSVLVGVPVLAFTVLGSGSPSPPGIAEIPAPSFYSPSLTLAQNQATGKKYTIPLGEVMGQAEDQSGKRMILPGGLSLVLSAPRDSMSAPVGLAQGTSPNPLLGGAIAGVSNPPVSSSVSGRSSLAIQETTGKAAAGNQAGAQTAVGGARLLAGNSGTDPAPSPGLLSTPSRGRSRDLIITPPPPYNPGFNELNRGDKIGDPRDRGYRDHYPPPILFTSCYQ